MIKKAAVVLTAILGLSGGLSALAQDLQTPVIAEDVNLRGADSTNANDSSDGKSLPASVSVSDQSSGASANKVAQTTGASSSSGGDSERRGLFHCMLKDSSKEFDNGVKDLTNNTSHKMIQVPAAIISLPFTTFAGCVEGTIEAIKGHPLIDPQDNNRQGQK